MQLYSDLTRRHIHSGLATRQGVRINIDQALMRARHHNSRSDGVICPLPKKRSSVLVERTAYPYIVLVIPIDGTPGNLENICLEASYDDLPWLKPHLDAYISQTPAMGWSIGHQAKARMQTIIASHCEENPFAGLGRHFKFELGFKVPVNHRAFDSIAGIFENFESMIAG